MGRVELYPRTLHGVSAADFMGLWRSQLRWFASRRGSLVEPGPDGRVDFSGALLALKAGLRICRASWLVHGQYVVLQEGYPDGIGLNASTAEATGLPAGTVCRFEPYLMMCVGKALEISRHPAQWVPSFVPWQPSVSDLLADDWIVEDVPPASQSNAGSADG